MNIATRSFTASGQFQVINGRRPTLAIISTFDDLCGIAGYTRSLCLQLESRFQIEVFDLEQFFMRSVDPRVRRLADDMVRRFAERLKDFDAVNIQLEHGTLGDRQIDIIRRFKMLAEAAPALSVTFHTVLQHETVNYFSVIKRLSRLDLQGANRLYFGVKHASRVNKEIYGSLRRLATVKPVSVIVHNRRDMRLMRYVHRLPKVYDHPLVFMSPQVARDLKRTTTRASIPMLARLPASSKVIGVFGFLSEYKGFESVIRALHLLPDDYHVAFFGGVHPNEIRRNDKVYSYVSTLLDEAYVNKSVFDNLKDVSVSMSVSGADASIFLSHPKDLSRRIHFLGPQTDENFAKGMAVCDLVVLPYIETGQSSSGPLSIAIEMDCRVIAARNHAFLQFARYHPDSVEFFDIGNHLELADRILSAPAFPAQGRSRPYNCDTNIDLYVAANTAEAAKASMRSR
jgi:glycosyltransferase involved in cell wall biosynthesis